MTQERSETPSNLWFRAHIFVTFFEVKFFILESVIPQIPVSVTYQTCARPFLVNKVYATENKHLFGIYAVVNQVTLCPKEIIHMFVT